MSAEPVDLAASHLCELRLLNREGRTKSVLLPGSATVSIDGHELLIPEGQTRWVLSETMAYELVSSVSVDHA